MDLISHPLTAKIRQLRALVGDTPYMGVDRAIQLTRFVADQGVQEILELGFAHGVSTCYFAAALEQTGGGKVVTIDQESARKRQPPISDLLIRTGLEERVSVFFEPTSYTWRLMRFLEQEPPPTFDFCYVDGAHTWFVDGLAFFLVDRLLTPGGWIVFDDLNWSYAASRTVAASKRVAEMPANERRTRQISKVFDILVKRHPGYAGCFESNGIGFAQKVEPAKARCAITMKRDGSGDRLRLLVVTPTGQGPTNPGPGETLAGVWRRLQDRWDIGWHEPASGESRSPSACLETIVRMIRAMPARQRKLPVLLSGSPQALGPLVWGLVRLRIRSRVSLILHVRADRVPLASKADNLVALCDEVVVETQFGKRAVQHCCSTARPRVHKPIMVIPAAAECGSDLREDARACADLRGRLFAGEVRPFLVGHLVDGSIVDHRAGCALQAFRIFAQGHWWRCGQCRSVVLFDHHPESLTFSQTENCNLCGGSYSEPGACFPDSHFVIATSEAARSDAESERMQEIRGLARKMGLEEQVWFVEEAKLRELAYELDVHLFPHDGAAVEPAVLMAWAMGIPTVTTNFGSAREVLGDGVIWAQPALTTQDSWGQWTAHPRMRDLVAGLVNIALPNAQDLGRRVPMHVHGIRARQDIEMLWNGLFRRLSGIGPSQTRA